MITILVVSCPPLLFTTKKPPSGHLPEGIARSTLLQQLEVIEGSQARGCQEAAQYLVEGVKDGLCRHVLPPCCGPIRPFRGNAKAVNELHEEGNFV